MKVKEFLTNVVVLNQDERPDRLERTARTLNAAGIPFTRFPAYPPASAITQEQMDAWNANVPASKREHLTVTRASASRIAAILSYAEIMDHAIKSGAPHVVVFEDDVYVPPDFRVRIEPSLRELPDDWQFLAIGMALTAPPKVHSEHLWANPVGWGNFAYAARGLGLVALRNLWKNPVRPGDHLWAPYLRETSGVYAVRPLLAVHLLCDSNTKLVTGKFYPMLTRAFSWLGSSTYNKRTPRHITVPGDMA